MNTLNVSIVTPNGEAYRAEEASMVVLGTTSGQVGIMANHVPNGCFIKNWSIKSGFSWWKRRILAVSEGFVETHKDKITVIVQTAELDKDIDVERAKRAKDRAEKRIAENQEGLDVRRAQLALAKALTRIKVAENILKDIR